jgi:hypothetical protein
MLWFFPRTSIFWEAVVDAKTITREQGRWIELDGTVPVGGRNVNQSPSGDTAAIAINQDTYAACLGPRHYPPRS